MARTHKTNKAVSTMCGTRISERVFCDYNRERIRACRNRCTPPPLSPICLNLYVTSALYIFIARAKCARESPSTRGLCDPETVDTKENTWRKGSRDGETNKEKKRGKRNWMCPRDESRPRECDGHSRRDPKRRAAYILSIVLSAACKVRDIKLFSVVNGKNFIRPRAHGNISRRVLGGEKKYISILPRPHYVTKFTSLSLWYLRKRLRF